MTLADTGQIHITRAALRSYIDHWEDIGEEEARRELLDYLADAKRQSPPNDVTRTGAEAWRFRRNSAGVDLSISVVRTGNVAEVVALNVRAYKSRSGGRNRG